MVRAFSYSELVDQNPSPAVKARVQRIAAGCR
jgi:hypothetical protein